jgi:hypothetical protein
MTKNRPFLVAIAVALAPAHASPPTVDRLHREFGSTATVQHGTILTALIGDKKVRPHIVAVISPIIETFENACNNFSNLCTQIRSISSEPDLQIWRLANLSINAQLLEDYRKLQEEFGAFAGTMLQGTPQEIGEEVDKVYNGKKGLMAQLQSLRSVFAIDEEHNEIAKMLAKIVDGEKRVILRFLFKRVKKSLKATKQCFINAQSQLDLIKDDPEITSFRDVITRLDSLEKQMDLVAHFLSMRHKTSSNTFFGMFVPPEAKEPPQQFARPSSHDSSPENVVESSWGDKPEYSWEKGF